MKIYCNTANPFKQILIKKDQPEHQKQLKLTQFTYGSW